MKKQIILTIAALIALTPMIGAAQAQSHAPTHAPAKERLDQASPKPQAERQRWTKGSRYRGQGSQVTNHRRHNLNAPPAGHRWVRDGNDFLLVAIGTGIIASIVQGR